MSYRAIKVLLIKKFERKKIIFEIHMYVVVPLGQFWKRAKRASHSLCKLCLDSGLKQINESLQDSN